MNSETYVPHTNYDSIGFHRCRNNMQARLIVSLSVHAGWCHHNLMRLLKLEFCLICALNTTHTPKIMLLNIYMRFSAGDDESTSFRSYYTLNEKKNIVMIQYKTWLTSHYVFLTYELCWFLDFTFLRCALNAILCVHVPFLYICYFSFAIILASASSSCFTLSVGDTHLVHGIPVASSP